MVVCASCLDSSEGRVVIGIDLFSGAGGLSAGAVVAGIEIAVAVESDPHAVSTYQANHPNVAVLKEDIRSLPDIPPIDTSRPTIVFGGPPCQGFSTSNQRTRNINNPNNRLYVHFLRHVRSIRPTYVVFENVKGFIETERGFFFSAVVRALEQLGYHVEHAVLNAADYGVPQRRSRLFIVGARAEGALLPGPTTGCPTTVAQAISDLPELPNGAAIAETCYRTAPRSEYSKLLRGNRTACTNNFVTKNADYVVERYAHIPQGGNWRCIPEHLMRNYTNRTRCHDGIYHRLSWESPSIVIGNYRKNMLVHPSANRGLSVREAARLQSFSDSYIFSGSIGFQQQQVANAVPPLLGEAVFKKLAKRDHRVEST